MKFFPSLEKEFRPLISITSFEPFISSNPCFIVILCLSDCNFNSSASFAINECRWEGERENRSVQSWLWLCSAWFLFFPLLLSYYCYLSASFPLAAFFLPSFLLFPPLSSHWGGITAAGRSNIGALRQMELSHTKVKIIIQFIYHLLHLNIMIIKQMHNLAEDLS